MVRKSDIKKLILQSKKSNLKNHRKDAFFTNRTKYSGEVRSTEILLWRSSHFLRGAYPIFHLKFDENDKLIGIETSKNPFDKFLSKIMIGFFCVLALGLILTSNFRQILFGIIAFSVITFLMHLILSKARKFETKVLTEELREVIENIESKNKAKSKGTLHKNYT